MFAKPHGLSLCVGVFCFVFLIYRGSVWLSNFFPVFALCLNYYLYRIVWLRSPSNPFVACLLYLQKIFLIFSPITPPFFCLCDMLFLGLLKDFLPPSKFPLFGYVLIIFYLAAGVSLTAVAGNFRSREQDKFQCTIPFDVQSDERNNQFLQEKCYQKYDLQYNSRLPLWVVVLMESALILTVSLFYSCWLQTALARVVPQFNVLEAEFSRQKQHPRRISLISVIFVLLGCSTSTNDLVRSVT